MLGISWEKLKELEWYYGDAFYLLDINAFQKNYLEFLETFRRKYPKTNIAYSYKTNYIPKICECVNSMGGYAEVVSAMEYELALKVGVPPERIIFNGPYKSQTNIEKAMFNGSIVNLDSWYEVPFVLNAAKKLSYRDHLIGIRCNFDIGTDKTSRFGFDVEGEQFRQAITTINNSKNCRVAGLHCHFSTPHRSLASYYLRTRRMLELCTEQFGSSHPLFIDIGGGFFGKMDPGLQEQFSVSIPDYNEYAEVISSQFAEGFPPDRGPELIVEPGTAIVSDVMKFVTKVIDIKTVRSKSYALVTGSVHNIKPSFSDIKLPIQIISQSYSSATNSAPVKLNTVDIVGYTCMEKDCLYKDYQGELSPGDYIIFDNAGAYTNVLKPPFIKPCPPILSFNKTLVDFEVVKRNETFADIFETYRFSSQ